MRISVDSLPDGGRTQTFGAQNPWAVEAVKHALDAVPAHLSGELLVEHHAKGVHVGGRVAVGSEALCARCGELTLVELSFEPDLEYRPAAKAAEEDVELNQDELDVGWYEDGELDLADVLCEAVALALPARVVCGDEVGCEERFLKLKSANSQDSAPVGPFAVLKNLR